MPTKRSRRTFFVASICLLAATSVATAQYSGGSGTAEDPYQIATAPDLMLLGESPDDWDKHFVLTADIDLDPNLPERKVFERAVIDSFKGVFDGDGHIISHLTIQGNSNLGLFRRLQDGASISNLGMEAVDVNGTGDYVGGLVGYNNEGTITMSYCTGAISGDEYVGGMVGENASGGSITASHSNVAVRGNRNVAGLVGRNFGSITTCHSAGAASGTIRHVGGLVGANNGSIAATYSIATVTGGDGVGGLVGVTGEEEDTSITMSYSTGAVSGGDNVGGFVGENLGSIASGFWDVETSGLLSSEGGIGKTTAEMQTAGTFLEAGWDFVGEVANGSDDIWKISEGFDYPLFWWEKYGGGTGESNDPYLIYTVEHLDAMGTEPNDWDKHFKLMADIDLSAYSYDEALIAPDANAMTWWEYDGIPFNGVFDGNDYTISHLKIVGRSYLGLFGQLGSGAEISNLGVEAVDVHGIGNCVGGLVGCNRGDVVHCYSTGTVTGDCRVGGLMGDNYGNVTHCYSTGTVTGDCRVGGLSGDNSWDGGTITECYSTCEVSGRGSRAGGLVGASSGSITMSYSTGTVRGEREIGGLVGSSRGDVTDCYSAGAVIGQESVGGLVGANDDGAHVADCFSTGPVSGDDKVGGLVGANWDAYIVRCFSTAAVEGIENVGGLAGSNTSHFDGGDMYQCYSNGAVSGHQRVGGLVGWNTDVWGNGGRVTQCYSRSTVSGYRYVGGLLGSNTDPWGNGVVDNCYSTGVVLGFDSVGGLVGASGLERQCFWDTQTSGLTDMCGTSDDIDADCDGAYGKITAELQTARVFLDAGWDFMEELENGTEDIWWILEGRDYPRLWWELIPEN